MFNMNFCVCLNLHCNSDNTKRSLEGEYKTTEY